MRKFRCLGLTESAGDKGSPDKLRPPGAGVGKAEGARGRTGGELGTAKLAPGSPPPPAAAVRLSLVQTAGEVKIGSLNQQVGSALAAAGGP